MTTAARGCACAFDALFTGHVFGGAAWSGVWRLCEGLRATYLSVKERCLVPPTTKLHTEEAVCERGWESTLGTSSLPSPGCLASSPRGGTFCCEQASQPMAFCYSSPKEAQRPRDAAHVA